MSWLTPPVCSFSAGLPHRNHTPKTANTMRSSRCRQRPCRGSAAPHHEDEAHPQGPSCQDLRHALVNGQKASCLCVSGRQTHHLGCVHHQQGTRNSSPLFLGHDLRILTKRQLRGLWWSRQHLLHLQLERKRRPYTGGTRA